VKKVIYASIYGGDGVNYGGGKRDLWIKNDGEAEGVLNLSEGLAQLRVR
jgi:hypothetical protein